MDEELEKKLIDQFPAFFRDMYGNCTKTAMSWGCSCSSGWYKIIEDACKKIAALGETDFYFAQIKEKFGGLRLYYFGGNSEIGKIISEAEDESYKTCEECGTKENITTEGSWILTLCKTCREKKR